MAPLLGNCPDALLSINSRVRCDCSTRYGRSHSVAHGQQVLACQDNAGHRAGCGNGGSYLVYRDSSLYSSSQPRGRRLLGCGAPAFRLSIPQEEVAYRPSATLDRPQILSRSLRRRSDAEPACEDGANDLGSGSADPNGFGSHLGCAAYRAANGAAPQERELRTCVRGRPHSYCASPRGRPNPLIHTELE